MEGRALATSVEDRAALEQVLTEEVFGVLCMCRAGEPYAVPLNHAYVDGRIILHTAHAGKKLEFIVARQTGPVTDHGRARDCHVPCDSVACRGRLRLVDDLDERAVELNAFLRRYAKDAKPLTMDRVKGCSCMVLTIDEMTGRHESEGREVVSTRWKR
jgi:nitroimidazol reductase NimA-like FMN-containing flavoprotein (pyridoxamine 5'-phosphate oxidase superfamily)